MIVPCLFTNFATTLIIVLIYVDDILVIGNNSSKFQLFANKFDNMFSFKGLGDLHYFLGFEVFRDDTGIYLTQRKYILDLLKEFNMLDASPSPTPMVARKNLATNEVKPMQNPSDYRRALGGF